MSKWYPCIYCTEDLHCTKFAEPGYESLCVLGPCTAETPSVGDMFRRMSDFERIQKARAGKPEGGTEVTIIKCDRCGAEVKNKDDFVVVSISDSLVGRVMLRCDFCDNCSDALIAWIREHPKEAPHG